jgi:hypothetical protein
MQKVRGLAAEGAHPDCRHNEQVFFTRRRIGQASARQAWFNDVNLNRAILAQQVNGNHRSRKSTANNDDSK